MRSDTFADRLFTFTRSQVLLMDTLLAVVLFVLSVLSLTTDADVGFSLLLIAPLIFRRALPMFTFGLVTAVGLFQLVVFYGFLPANVSALIVIYTIAAYGERWASRLVLVTGLLGAPLGAGVFYSSEYYGGSDAFVTVTFTIAVSVVAAWALGTLRRSRLQQMSGLEERARLREQERQQELRLAASTERARARRHRCRGQRVPAQGRSAEEMLAAVRTVHAGDGVISASSTRRLLQHVGPMLRDRTNSGAAGGDAGSAADAANSQGLRADRAALAELTPREGEVLVQMAYGASNTEIAALFVVSEATVKTHVGRVLAKTGSRDRVQAIVLAYRAGLIGPADLLRVRS